MNLIDDGLRWFNNVRNETLTEDVTIITPEGTAVIAATVIDAESAVNAATGVRIKTEKVLFIVNTTDIAFTTIKRGIRFIRRGKNYEVIVDRTKADYPNDPNNNETVIPCKLCS